MWLSDLNIVLPDRVLEGGSIKVEAGRIAAVIEGPAPDGADAFRAPGLLCIPGIIDLHGDMLERDIEPRPRAMFPVEMALFELDKRLAAAGITTAYAAVSFAWHRTDVRSQENATRIIEAIAQRRDELLVDMRVHARFEVTNPETGPVLSALLERDLVQLVSIMDHSPGQGQYSDAERYSTFLVEWFGIDRKLLEENVLNKVRTVMEANKEAAKTQIRNWDIVRDVVERAVAKGVPVASHDDDSPEKVQMQAGFGISISEFPVTLAAAQAARDCGMHVIMGAPNAYRGESNTGNLSAREGVRAGVVDILATDYFPAAPLHAAILLAEQGILPLHESARLISQHPAEAMGLNDRGRIAPGLSADLVLLEAGAHHRVRATLRAGVPIYWDTYMARLADQQGFHFMQG